MANWPKAKSWAGMSTDQRDYAAQITRMARLYSHPVLIGRRGDSTPIGNGSGFLFKPAGRRFLVTNAHVIEGYESIAVAHDDAIVQFGSYQFEPRVAAKEKIRKVDLAVLDVGDIEFPRTFASYWGPEHERLETYAPTPWPLPPPVDGEPVVIVGWPGKHRVVDDKDVVEFASVPLIGLSIADVDAEHFTIPIEREDLIASDYDPQNRVVDETDFEGISGSPVFAMRNGPQPLHLIGVVHAYIFDTLICTRADLIKVDGSITLMD
jgi:hypothetical protein